MSLTISIFCSLYATLGKNTFLSKNVFIILYMGYTDNWALSTWPIKDGGAGSFGHHYCIFDAILYNSWQPAAIFQPLVPAVRDKNKGCGDTCLFTVAAAAAANWEKHIQHRKKKKKVQPNLPSRSVYITTG